MYLPKDFLDTQQKEVLAMEFLQKKDYYKILEVKTTANSNEIKVAYRKLAKEFHPDLHANNPLAKLANEKFKEINEAYEVLSDEDKRKQYDSMTTGLHFEEMNVSKPKTRQETPPNREEKKEQRKEKGQKERREYHAPMEERGYNTSTINNETCCMHKDRQADIRCIICDAPLCMDCAKLFDRPFCPRCLKKNNDIYIKKLKFPFIVLLVSLVVGMSGGVFFGLRYNLLGDYGIIEAISSGVYLSLSWLYFWYAAPIIARILYTTLGAIVSFLDEDRRIAVVISDIIVIILGISVGWVIGIAMGFIKLKDDYKAYTKYKPEYEETKVYLKKNFGI